MTESGKGVGGSPPGWVAVLREPATLRFAIVGVGAFLGYMALTWALLAAGLVPFAAGLLAYLGAFIGAYLLQQGWSFRGNTAHKRALPRYALTQAGCALLSAIIVMTAKGFDAPDGVAAALAAVLAAGTSFILSRFWVFAGST